MMVSKFIISKLIFIILSCLILINKGYSFNEKYNPQKVNDSSDKYFSIFIYLEKEFLNNHMKARGESFTSEKRSRYQKEVKLAYGRVMKNRKESDNVPIGDITHQEFIKVNKEGMLNSGIPYEGWLFKDVFEVLSIDKQNRIIGRLLNSFSNKSLNGESALFASIWLDMKEEAAQSVSIKQQQSQAWLEKMRKIPLVITLEETINETEKLFNEFTY
ncbi:TPA: hypothetical protein U2J52_003189 [Providencia rettgeri]|uniref:hypothetical protein n=1 Tax=Providencia TaxID=586 RepID=UPI001CA607F9|nr:MULTISPECIES: hypothetical protein [Providencia]QZY63399.1 hypothetical protein K7H99_14320 [Providencia rettgeri]HEM7526954.1 hypothetical protein [Providencia rettgeri]